jgi:signal transduction histidine kinase
MDSIDVTNRNMDARMKLAFILLVGLIVAGNGLLLWQFHTGQLQATRVTRVSDQMSAVLRLQGSLLSLHQRLGELAQLKDASGLAREADVGRHALVDQLQQTKIALVPLPTSSQIDPTLLPTLDTIELALPAQLESITGLASLGDWNAVNFRIGEGLNPFEIEASTLVKIVDQRYSAEISQSQSKMENVRDRIILLVPLTAIYTFAIASLFAWVIARRILELRVEERVKERTRIARDLHDTLLQSFHGLLLSFQAAHDLLPLNPIQAKQSLASAMDDAADAVTEGRDAVQGLRSSRAESQNIAEAIRAIGEELVAEEAVAASADFRVEIEGRPRKLRPMIREEVYRIAVEALRNAFRHAHAKRIEVEIRFDDRQLRVRIRDDGKGIDSRVRDGSSQGRHFGLHGMRERAQLSGGKLAVWSEVGSGTEIEMTLPACIAYAAPNQRFGWSNGFYRKGTDQDRLVKL